MTPQQIHLVESSFERIKPIAAQAGRLFYDRLFAVDPSLRRMFRSDPEEQARKLMQVLAVAVGSLSRIEQLIPTLEQMGGRHAAYGVQDRHYETVGACLLWALEQGLGEDFTPVVRDAWSAAYDVLAGAMKRGAMAHALSVA